MYQLKGNSIQVSVRNFVEFILRTGSIDNRISDKKKKNAMLMGANINRKIQKEMTGDYKSEVSLRTEVACGDVKLLLEGRADGIFTKDDVVIIDEIKGMYGNVATLEKANTLHMAQAICYGYMYGKEYSLSKMGIQVTYCNLDTNEMKRFLTYFSWEQLQEQFNYYVEEFSKWANYLYHHKNRRTDTIKQVDFPFEYRSGQRDLVVNVYRAIARETVLYVQAPTGIGKTISTIFPAIKAMGEELTNKIFYTTAKTITRTVAEESFRILRTKGMDISSCTITAKEKLCPMENCECNPEACPYANGHFNRVNKAVYDIITSTKEVSREVIEKYANKYMVCPFELNLDVTYWVDGIICDYNYVFDPNVRLQRYFSDGMSSDYVFLVDEAHNLVERAREMYSATIRKQDFLEGKKQYKGFERITRQCSSCNKILLEMRKQCETYELYEIEEIKTFISHMKKLCSELEKFSELHPHVPITKEMSDLFFKVRNFLSIYEKVDENYEIYGAIEEKEFAIKLFCINPSNNLKECYLQGRSIIFFSATMLPINYYKELFSGTQDQYAIYIPSPFSQNNRLLCIAKDISSKYTRRNTIEFRKIKDYIHKVTSAKYGNYMVFFPSYSYMKQVYDQFDEKEKEQIIVQKSQMNEEEREQFLAEFSEQTTKITIGFCVLGGIFSEGIDLKYNQLIGVIVVGTGLPQVCIERELLKKFYDRKGKSGFDFSYRYPAMNKVLQAAGRLIRTDKDEGVIVLLDERFLYSDYVEQFPMEWNDYIVTEQSSIEKRVSEFWSNRKDRFL